MNYNDFPILNNEEYNLLNEHYSSLYPFNRKELINNLCLEINICCNTCLKLSNQFNPQIRNSINNSHQTLIKLFNNFSSLFNVQIKPNQLMDNLSIFTFIKRIINITKLLNQWLVNENKEYYISIIKKSILDIFNSLENIFSSLEKSNLLFFKHM